MRIRVFSATALFALAVTGPVWGDATPSLLVAQRSIDMGYAAGFLTDQASQKIHANWHNGAGPRGLSGAVEAGQVWYTGKGAADRAGSSSHLLGSTAWASYSDGDSWTVNLTGTRFDGRTQFGTLGRHDMSGYAISTSGARRFGNFVLGAHNSFVWLDFKHAIRRSGVPLSDTQSKSSGHTENGGIDLGYRIGADDWSIVPFVGMQYEEVSMGRFSEHGVDAMSFSKSGYHGWKTNASISAQMGRLVFSEIEVRPTVDVGYERWLGARQIKVTGQSLDTSTAALTTWAAMPGRNAVTVRPELDFSWGGALHLRASYLYRWQKTSKEQGVWLKLAFRGL